MSAREAGSGLGEGLRWWGRVAGGESRLLGMGDGGGRSWVGGRWGVLPRRWERCCGF